MLVKKVKKFLKNKLDKGIKSLQTKERQIQEEEKNYSTKKSYVCR